MIQEEIRREVEKILGKAVGKRTIDKLMKAVGEVGDRYDLSDKEAERIERAVFPLILSDEQFQRLVDLYLQMQATFKVIRE